MEPKSIICDGLVAGYKRGLPLVVKNVSFSVEKGSLTVLCGPNGSGKSTLLKALCSLLPLQGGTVTFNGKDMKSLSKSGLSSIVSFLPQQRPVPDCSVERLVLYGRFPHTSFPKSYGIEDREIAAQILSDCGLSSIALRNVRTLSGGQRQKVYLAMALAQDTPVIMLDEPLSFLDIAQQLEFMAMLKRLAHDGKTVLMVCHDLNIALTAADSLLVMEEGSLVFSGTPSKAVDSCILEKVFGVKGLPAVLPDGSKQYFFTAP